MYTKPILGQQINWAHPLAKGLVGCWVMNEGSGDRIYDLCKNADGVTSGTIWHPEGLTFDTNTDYVNCGTFNPSSNDLTLVVGMKWGGDIGNQGIVAKRDSWNAAYMMWQLAYNTDLNCLVFQRAGQTVSFTSIAPTVGVRQVLSLVHQAGGKDLLYIDGLVKSNQSPITFGTGTASALVIGNTQVGVSEGFFGDIYYSYIYNRVLTPQEILQLHQEPYAMFTRDEIELDYEEPAEDVIYNAIFVGMDF